MTPTARRSARVAVALAVMLGIAAICPRSADAYCTVSVSSGVSFGPYNVFSGTPVDSTGTFTWQCSFFTYPYVRITLTKGGSTTYLPRRMQSGANTLSYNLYREVGRTNIWGDETEGTSAYYRQYPGSGTITLTVYGRIPAGQDAAVGSYSDTITVVVNY
jgi:spore coat protein U-like protein